VLKPDGDLLANLILDGKLETPYARNLQVTIDSVFGRCAVDVLHKGKCWPTSSHLLRKQQAR
jgi:hypothetical protein